MLLSGYCFQDRKVLINKSSFISIDERKFICPERNLLFMTYSAADSAPEKKG